MTSAVIFTAFGFLLRCALDVAADLFDRHRNGEDAQRARLMDPCRDCRPRCTVVRRLSD